LTVNAEEICVAHLVRRVNDFAAFRAFLESYRSCPAGIAHQLLIIFKGFSREAQLAPYDELLKDFSHQRAFVRDAGFDVRPYVKVARDYPYRFFAFLNSFSRVLVPGWLEAMYRHVRRPRVGIVGATGSHQSILADFQMLRFEFRPSRSLLWRAAAIGFRHARYFALTRGRFTGFPNYHVRTNGFLVSRDIMSKIRCGPVLTKWDAYRFESGAAGMTPQIMAAGLTPLVVGADGVAYEPENWPDARTFWISRQENLLISDNQTRAYTNGSEALRDRLAFHAWRRRPDGTPRQDLPPLSS